MFTVISILNAYIGHAMILIPVRISNLMATAAVNL